ncbi:sodium:solute symporter [Microscilla marina]|uniref:Sodium-coupled permease, putative n=1 Tax=Microscilla marina ATCC 23134 TaxID=313606 RepID=A1ZT17_MICM2|nr:sodium:solute symporter [Microscilla marina]EAY26407.1 sodium-coupled permease, putative [Microscilla marina ATCC 23134]
MTITDWLILIAFFSFTLWDGLRKNKSTKSVEDLLLANRSMPWWAVGLSVMATQASAISFVGTAGQAYVHDMRFVQVYLSVPLAMIILSITLLPFYNRLRIFTVYEALEHRFGLKVRLLTSFLFLLSRGLSMGLVIAAPAYVLSVILRVPLSYTIIVIGIGATVYTVFGGITGVIRTDIKQMVLMMGGLVFCFVWIWSKLPQEVGFTEALQIAGATAKLKTIDFTFDAAEKYNLWSGLLAGLFLMLSYFGTDQSQAQRYLTAKSLNDARGSLMMTAFAKIPMMFFMLLLGVFLYVFYVFKEAPLLFIPNQAAHTEQASTAKNTYKKVHQLRAQAAYQYLKAPHHQPTKQAFIAQDRALNRLRQAEIKRQEKTTGIRRNDTNYILPYFVLTQMPAGLVGIIVATILAAALSSIDSGLNSLASSTVIDWQKRLHTKEKPTHYYLNASRVATAGWGIFAVLAALAYGETDSIVELVNKVGSYFYGAILGVFVLIWVKPANGSGAFVGLLLGMLTVFLFDNLYLDTDTQQYHFFGTHETQTCKKALAYLWLNPIGTLSVVFWGVIIGIVSKYKNKREG